MSSSDSNADDAGQVVHMRLQHGVPGQSTGTKPLYSEDHVPQRYNDNWGGDIEKATRRWKKTFEWRKENKVDEIINTPQPHFLQCREVFPVYVHGRSRKGMPVLWDLVGKFDLPKADKLNFDLALLTPYYVFLNECIWRVLLDKGENDDDLAQFITVEDVSGVQLKHLASSRLWKVMKALTGTMKEHYVERCHKTYIINAPSSFAIMWRLVAPMLGSRTRNKVTILGKDYLKTMEKEIDISQIPVQYGGRSERVIDDSDDERKIQSLVKRLNSSSEGDEGERQAAVDNGGLRGRASSIAG